MATESMQPRLPNSTQRTVVIGRTGSGKTVAGCWHLSRQEVDLMPWVIINFKSDALIDSIPYAEHVEVGFVPSKPGVYIVHPTPNEGEKLEEYLWKIWEHRRIGVFCDEGYMMGAQNEAFNTLLTQGRSLRIPMIVNTQRPVWLSRFAFSEADFFQLFHLNDERDLETVESFIPVRGESVLPEYHSFYFEVGRNKLWRFKPVPGEQEILAALETKLRRKKPIRL